MTFNYEQPEVVDYGRLEELTAGCQDGEELDADFPDGTPKSQLTFSSPCRD